MEDDTNITPLFGQSTQSAPVVSVTPARSYNIKIKEGPLFENQLGYLSVNGLFLVLTDTPNDALAINFYALLEDVQYVVQSEEVITETETAPF